MTRFFSLRFGICCWAFGGGAWLLGQTAAMVGTALGLSLFWINSVLVAAASSFPEFQVMKDLFQKGKDFEAAYMASGSNAANIGLGIMGTAIHGVRTAATGN